MKKSKNAAFTLIELVAVLVIMAIIALIVTPLVMTIIRKARISADRRSIDAYGRSIEYAIASYLLDNGRFPTDISDLTIEYSGNEVVCSHAQLNSDSSVYLSGCTVGGRSVDYSYGSDKTPPVPTYTAYSVGDEVRYNNVDYYVIADSGINESTVTLLKAEPLTVDEVNTYGEGHINRYTSDSVGTASNLNGYGTIAYYSSETCGYVNGSWVYDGCTNDYAYSEIKYAVDSWKNEKAQAASEARLITLDEVSSLGYEWKKMCDTCGMGWVKTDDVPTWLYNSSYWYWTISQFNDSAYSIWNVYNDGSLVGFDTYSGEHGSFGVVRPVITLSKSVLN